MGDPFFDLGNFSINHELTADDDALLLSFYEGTVPHRPPRPPDAHAGRIGFPRSDVGRTPAGDQHPRCRFRGVRRASIRSVARERLDAALQGGAARRWPPLRGAAGHRRDVTAARCQPLRFGRGAGAGGHHRRRRGRHVDRVPPRRSRVARHRARRARGAHQRIDLSQRRARRPAARVGHAHEDDDVRVRPVPPAQGRHGHRSVVARGRLDPPRLVEGADGGAGAAGRLGQDIRAADGAHHCRRGA